MNEFIHCVCLDPECTEKRLINFNIKSERKNHLNHNIFHLEDFKEFVENDDAFENLK